MYMAVEFTALKPCSLWASLVVHAVCDIGPSNENKAWIHKQRCHGFVNWPRAVDLTNKHFMFSFEKSFLSTCALPLPNASHFTGVFVSLSSRTRASS